MNNENIFKNLDFNETKQTLKQAVDKANNGNDVLWALLFLVFHSFKSEELDKILSDTLEKFPDLKKQIEELNNNNNN